MLFSRSLLYTHFRKIFKMFSDVERKKTSDLDDYIHVGYFVIFAFIY